MRGQKSMPCPAGLKPPGSLPLKPGPWDATWWWEKEAIRTIILKTLPGIAMQQTRKAIETALEKALNQKHDQQVERSNPVGIYLAKSG